METNRLITYIVQSGDKGAWVWPTWYHYFRKYWDHTQPIDVLFISETYEPILLDVPVVRSHAGAWGSSVRECIRACVRTPLCVLTHEDYLLNGEVDYKTLQWLADVMQLCNIDLVKLCGEWAGWDDPAHRPYPSDVLGLHRYHEKSAYQISHQMSLWRTSFLISSIEDNDTPWSHETASANRQCVRGARIYAYMKPSPIPYAETCTQGKIRAGAEHFFTGGSNE